MPRKPSSSAIRDRDSCKFRFHVSKRMENCVSGPGTKSWPRMTIAGVRYGRACIRCGLQANGVRLDTRGNAAADSSGRWLTAIAQRFPFCTMKVLPDVSVAVKVS